MEEKIVHIPTISCGHCAMTIKSKLGDIKGVVSVDGDPVSKKVPVRWESPLTWEEIGQTLKEIGFLPEEG